MAEPPSYAESMSEFQVFGAPPNIEKRGPLPKESHESQSLERQVELAMNRLVAPVVPQVVDYVYDRVLRGLSQTTVALIPSDQGKSCSNRELRETIAKRKPKAPYPSTTS
jgi:hypothetical protein